MHLQVCIWCCELHAPLHIHAVAGEHYCQGYNRAPASVCPSLNLLHAAVQIVVFHAVLSVYDVVFIAYMCIVKRCRHNLKRRACGHGAAWGWLTSCCKVNAIMVSREFVDPHFCQTIRVAVPSHCMFDSVCTVASCN